MERIGTRDWAHLHPELLEMIAARITEIVDRICFSSVCPQWRSASKSVAHDLPPQLPWLLLPKDRPRQLLPWPKDSKIIPARRLFSLSRNRIFDIPLPEPRGTRIYYYTFHSPFGRMVVPQGIETLALVNPLTRSLLTLPPLPLTETRRKLNGAFALKKAKVFASNLVVAVVFPDYRDILFCRLGESSWKTLNMASWYPIRDFVYYKGKFLVIHSEGENVWVFDADTLQKISEIPFVGGEDSLCVYLVESSAGDLLLVHMTWCEAIAGKTFELFQLDEREEQVKWMKINNTGDNALFVDYVQAFAFDATGSNCWRGNCIYFLDYLPSANIGLMVFNVGEGEIEELPLFSYSPEGHLGSAMWVAPTLC